MTLLVLLTFVVAAYAYSQGDPYICDAMYDKFGCDTFKTDAQCNGNARLCCTQSDVTSRIMTWTLSPKESNNYTLWIGNNKGAPQTTYFPNELITVNIETNSFNAVFRGLLIYAEKDIVSTTPTKVGTWELSPDPAQLWHVGDIASNCGPTTLTHYVGTQKPYIVTLRWRAPAQDEGTLRFRALIKAGDANMGEFWYPPGVQQGSIRISSRAAPKRDIRVKGILGESCTEACKRVNAPSGCGIVATAGVNSEQDLKDEFYPYVSCFGPTLSGCGALGPRSAFDGMCYYADTDCTGRTPNIPGSVSCDAKATSATEDLEGSRLCICSAGSSLFANFPLFGLLALFFGPKQTKYIFLAMVILIYANSVSAHNWIFSTARLSKASTFIPCPQRSSPFPHAQLNVAGSNSQPFQIEWATGHQNTITYIVMVDRDNEGFLGFHSTSFLETYIRNAPAGGCTVLNTTTDAKLHRTFTDTWGSAVNSSFLYNGQQATSPALDRPWRFTGRWNGFANGGNQTVHNGVLWRYPASKMSNDIYCRYASTTAPWIISVNRFIHTYSYPSEFDTYLFKIYGAQAGKKYIAHYVWGGYRDCIDIEVISTAVAQKDVYGTFLNTSDIFQRVDHCYMFPIVTTTSTPYVDYGSCGYSKLRCLQTSAANCDGVQALPFATPSSVPLSLRSTVTLRWNDMILNASKAAWFGFRANGTIKDDTQICFHVQANQGDYGKYVVTEDPSSPYFYGTCYVRIEAVGLIGYNPLAIADQTVPWIYGENCISCADQSTFQSSFRTPKWTIASKCINCDLEPVTIAPVIMSQLTASFGCNPTSGFATCVNVSNCVKLVREVYRTVIGEPFYANSAVNSVPETCADWVARDPECSNVFSHRSSATCNCLRKISCCQCIPGGNVGEKLYIIEPKAAPAAGAGCTGGVVKSGICCLAQNVATGQPEVCHSNITRPCATYPAPCFL